MHINVRYTALNIIALAQNLGFGTNSLLRIVADSALVAFGTSGCICDRGQGSSLVSSFHVVIVALQQLRQFLLF